MFTYQLRTISCYLETTALQISYLLVESAIYDRLLTNNDNLVHWGGRVHMSLQRMFILGTKDGNLSRFPGYPFQQTAATLSHPLSIGWTSGGLSYLAQPLRLFPIKPLWRWWFCWSLASSAFSLEKIPKARITYIFSLSICLR